MGLKDDLSGFVTTTFHSSWSRRQGRVVPDVDSLSFKNEAVDLNATVLYADLADSTGLVAGWHDWFATDVYKTYLYCASRIIRANGGEITAYDGDRVMGVFVGEGQESVAARAALKINFAVNEIIRPVVQARWPENTFTLAHKVGIDRSELMVAKTGVRDVNDLVWVGVAANNAAKLAARDKSRAVYITESIYEALDNSSRNGGDPLENMWTYLGFDTQLRKSVYGSNWQWGL